MSEREAGREPIMASDPSGRQADDTPMHRHARETEAEIKRLREALEVVVHYYEDADMETTYAAANMYECAKDALRADRGTE